MTTQPEAAAPKPERKRRNLVASYNATVRIQIPTNPSDLNSISAAMKAINELRDKLPEGSRVEPIGATFGKMDPQG